ncbi:hypothetical protein LB542_13120 [Mesorhizobium sp. BR1-1-9]|uniref:hypothetical protein n=1 Tax=unclassified Mesorhizobium TaxID=325217 RepID=UPI001125B98F|nr:MULTISPECIES: hypothetical protein [unclassified Mesorhizobium]MBZ9807315.1 hypothetical protein [Mesorhizobium sp. ESP-6-2]MBZ9871793.1 hypothetical protein [Mesorhizobium sp. BR1-1-9]MBZ9944299.1 hypothetical protein [Mesorhizobium sp. BR1-1-13]TPM25206.1 hypothetical protein FJ955_24065 [Mesorhizobium sp. B2-2-2]
MTFNFDGPPVDESEADIPLACQRQLLPLVGEIVEAAVAAGWDKDDVLLAFVELAWDLYEKGRGDPQ